MYIAINEARQTGAEIINILPLPLRRCMFGMSRDGAEELRLICGKPMSVRYSDGIFFPTGRAILSKNPFGGVVVTEDHMRRLLETVTRSSLYSVKDEIRSGYITIDGGHRIGIAGTAVTENGSIEFIKNISAVNIRLANEIVGASDGVMGAVLGDTGVYSTLIVSPPCAGKTTLLRDIARNLAYGGYSVAIADERREIAAMHNGKSPFDLGNMTAVLEGCPKSDAMLMLLRSMSPDVILTDEIGTERDAAAIRTILNSGVAVVASIHGRDIKQLMRRQLIKELVTLFDVVITLSRRNGAGTIESVCAPC